MQLTRRAFAQAAASAALLAAAPGARAQTPANAKTLRFIAQSDLRVLDPIWTTAYISRNHGYCVFDTLFAIDAEFAPHPQMVGDFSISADKLTYRFKLRDGLAFHDDSPVRGVDCVASIKRWMARDSLGQSLALVLDEIKPDGDKAFTITLKEPFSLLIDAFAKVSSLALFVMPERLCIWPRFRTTRWARSIPR
jgi:peptide/nickel transport system substrate-binding protein